MNIDLFVVECKIIIIGYLKRMPHEITFDLIF